MVFIPFTAYSDSISPGLLLSTSCFIAGISFICEGLRTNPYCRKRPLSLLTIAKSFKSLVIMAHGRGSLFHLQEPLNH
ncbi:unnamed protein product [Arabis nemorensis]|uniref:Uncharacterized protein n=1 Tax=Arabis nemorensis TaxID=586526 RepID=A0A565CIL8_9BRAS|nr:unnamed protein product [Arabis nemorensis]